MQGGMWRAKGAYEGVGASTFSVWGAKVVTSKPQQTVRCSSYSIHCLVSSALHRHYPPFYTDTMPEQGFKQLATWQFATARWQGRNRERQGIGQTSFDETRNASP